MAGAFILLLVIGLGMAHRALVRYHSFLDDGPFSGVSTAPPRKAPDSTVRVGDILFECYNRQGDEPVVASKSETGKLLGAWVVHPGKAGSVQSLHLRKGWRTKDGYVVHGLASWTFGEEAATFYFDNDGVLSEFYLSW